MDLQGQGVVLHVRERAGSGTPVLLVHGWATSSAVWKPVLSRWEGDERLFAVDLRGVGYSDKPDTGYTLATHAADVAAVIDGLGGSVVLVGHSMGGAIAQRVAIDRPEAVQRLVLVSPVPASGVSVPEADRAYLRSLVGRREGMATALTSMMVSPSEDLEPLVDASASVCAAAYLEGLDAWTGADFADELGKITAPTVVFAGEEEQPLNPDLLRSAVVAPIAGAELVLLDGCGHYPQWEAPTTFTRLLEQAVRG